RVDAVVSAAGLAVFKPVSELSDQDFTFCLANKLMGQVNLVRYGLTSVNDGGSFTLTSGVLAQQPMPGSAAISLVNAGLEGFGRVLRVLPGLAGCCGFWRVLQSWSGFRMRCLQHTAEPAELTLEPVEPVEPIEPSRSGRNP